jgi:predicted kinase
MENNISEIRTIILCKGIQASGKTTWAKEQLKKYPGKYKRANRDDLRVAIDGDLYSWDNEKFITKIWDQIVIKALTQGYDIISDDTNLNRKVWGHVTEIAKNIGNVRVIEKYFPVTLKEAIKRNSERDRKVPENVVKDFFKKYIDMKEVPVRNDFFPRELPSYKKEDSDKIKAILVDVDGTIALNVTGRSYYDMTKTLEDKPNLPICNLVRMLSKNHSVVFVSGREDSAKEDTKLWFTEYDIPFDEIFMRKTGDSRKDFVVKEEIYAKYIKNDFDIRYVIDDKRQVVDMWRRLGLCCLQVAPGDF